jgi:hypothetical protein
VVFKKLFVVYFSQSSGSNSKSSQNSAPSNSSPAGTSSSYRAKKILTGFQGFKPNGVVPTNPEFYSGKQPSTTDLVELVRHHERFANIIEKPNTPSFVKCDFLIQYNINVPT